VCEKEGVAWLPETNWSASGGKIGGIAMTISGNFSGGSSGTVKLHEEKRQPEEGSYQPCKICGERITTENEAIAGWHYKCTNPEIALRVAKLEAQVMGIIGKDRDYYTKQEVDERMKAIFDQLETLITTSEFLGTHGKKGVRFPSGWKDQVTDLRRLFLS
jgi:hypothetical protein